MKRFMKVTVIIAVIFALGTTGTVFAASTKSPAEIVSELTGKTTDEVNSERVAGKTYGTIANDAGKLEEFKTQVLVQKRAYLDQRVKDGTLSQERADAIYDAIEEAQSLCDGTGGDSQGVGCGAGFGAGAGTGGCGVGASLGRGAGGCGMGGRFSR
jgi:hypothetical protein